MLQEALRLAASEPARNASVLATIGAARDEAADNWPYHVQSTTAEDNEPLSEAMSARFGIDLPELDDQLIEAIEEIYEAEGSTELELSAEIEFLQTDTRTSRAFKRATEEFARARNWTQDRAAKIIAGGYIVYICYHWGEAVESFEFMTRINNSMGALVFFGIVHFIVRQAVDPRDQSAGNDDQDAAPAE
ncbi:hypothetical protein GTA09_20440 [Rhodococcus hoagii]|nr:hypothetical protein [Prescottella equi]